jgi:hypothetical protein
VVGATVVVDEVVVLVVFDEVVLLVVLDESVVVVFVVFVVGTDVDASSVLDVLEGKKAVVGADERPVLLQAPSTATIVAAQAAASHALLMATPPSGSC